MRLNRLVVQGFGAFRDLTTFEFDDTDFFALVGPTGAGKSTVIDAVCFALYGSVPRYEDQRLNRYVVTLGASEAKASLEFELNGAKYTATRVVRRSAKGQVSTKEARLERAEDDGSVTTLAGAEREMTPAVEALLHLNFKDFTRCVALPQGEFAEFLRAKGEDRRALLVRLLNFDVYQRVGQRAGKRAEAAATEIALCRQQAEPLAYATAELLGAAKKRTKALKSLGDEMTKERLRIDEQLRLAAEQDGLAAESLRLARSLEAIALPEEVRLHGEAERQAGDDLKAAKGRLATAREKREKAEEAVKELPALADLTGVVDAHQRLTELTSDLEQEKTKLAAALEAEQDAQKGLEDQEEALRVAQAERDATRAALGAADLAQHLVVGEPCPVCLEVVRTIPEHSVPHELSDVEAAVKTAEDLLAKSHKQHRKASDDLARKQATVKALEEEQTRLSEKVGAHPDKVSLDALVEDVRAHHDALNSARDNEKDESRLCEEAQGRVDGLAEKARSYQAAYGVQRDPVVSLHPPEPAMMSVLADWDALVAWAGPTRTTQVAAAAAAEAKANEHRQVAEKAVQSYVERAAGLDVTAEGDLVAVLNAVTGASVEAAGEVATIEQDINRRKELEKQIRDADERRMVADELRKHLRADHFLEWLISEALGVLVADASLTLRALSNDTFSLALGEREFMVIDHVNADEQRSARTLSGGETFQASLALALALSDQVRSLAAEGAPQLDALFLDEGFGTLDPETLDTVAATIENLGQSGRMVGVITHVRELASRVPVRFEIRKGTRTATVEKVYA